MRCFKDLKVWQRSHRLTLSIYEVTRAFPQQELYGLVSQIRRSSASIPANIAEGCGRHGSAELTRFLSISMGSASELEYHLLLARDLGFVSGSDHDRLNGEVVELKRMLASLIKKLRADS